jgi:hypothetical protein
MSRIVYETDIKSPINRVFEYYTNPDNIKEAWPRDDQLYVMITKTISLNKTRCNSGFIVRPNVFPEQTIYSIQMQPQGLLV